MQNDVEKEYQSLFLKPDVVRQYICHLDTPTRLYVIRDVLKDAYLDMCQTADEKDFDVLELPDKEFRKQFGARVRLLRQALNMSKSSLSEKIGMTVGALTNVECGGINLSGKKLATLSRILKVSCDFLLGITEKSNAK